MTVGAITAEPAVGQSTVPEHLKALDASPDMIVLARANAAA